MTSRSTSTLTFGTELYIHATCTAAGYSPEVEPASVGPTIRELRVTVHATPGVVTTVLVEDAFVGDPAESRGEDAIVEQFIDHLNQLAPSAFWLGLDIVSRGPDAPKASAVRRAVKMWMDG